MSYGTRIKESRSYMMISTACHAMWNRLERTRRQVTWQNAIKLLSSWIIPAVVGGFLYQYFGLWFFSFSLWRGFLTVRTFHGATLLWSLSTCLSVITACWSVGGALLYFLRLSWQRIRLYSAGGK